MSDLSRDHAQPRGCRYRTQHSAFPAADYVAPLDPAAHPAAGYVAPLDPAAFVLVANDPRSIMPVQIHNHQHLHQKSNNLVRAVCAL